MEEYKTCGYHSPHFQRISDSLEHLRVPAADGLVCLDGKVRHAGAVLVPAGLVDTLEPDAPSTIDGAGADLKTGVLELELAVDKSPSLGLRARSNRLRAGHVSDDSLSCTGIRTVHQNSYLSKARVTLTKPRAVDEDLLRPGRGLALKEVKLLVLDVEGGRVGFGIAGCILGLCVDKHAAISCLEGRVLDLGARADGDDAEWCTICNGS